jgi:tetratricopeptide (TPR) repeat protein
MLSAGEWRLTSPARIFVSHTPEDDEFCQDLVGALRSAGADVWSNDHHYSLSQLLPVIEPEVRARPVFVVILSPAALRSGTVTAACTWAATYLRHDPTRLFLPVLAQPVDDASLRAFFEGFHTQPTMPIIQTLPRDQAILATLRSLSLLPTIEALPPPIYSQPTQPIQQQMQQPIQQPMPPMQFNISSGYGDHGSNPNYGGPTGPRSNPDKGRFKVVTAPPQHTPHAPHAMVGPHADDDVENLIVQGNTLRTQGRRDEALVSFQQAMQRNPQSPQAWFHLGFMYAELGRYPEALAAYDQALALDEQFALVWASKANVLVQLRRYDEALTACDGALVLDPNSDFAWNNKGVALAGLGRPIEALAAYDSALTRNPNSSDYWRNKGLVLAGMQRYDEAIAAYDSALAHAPSFGAAWASKATAQFRLGRYEDALYASERALTLMPSSASSWNRKASTLARLGRHNEALLACDRALALDPSFVAAWSNKGGVLAALGRHDEAIAACDRALTLDSRYSPAWTNKAAVLRALGRLDEASDAERRAHGIHS